MAHSHPDGGLDRRGFLGSAVRAACGTAAVALGLGVLTRQASGLPADHLRPPGALAEDDFLAACVRCGLCARDCPYDTLRLTRLDEDGVAGTPYFIARQVPCEMCEDIPCVPACPTGALDSTLTRIDDARMGVAVLVDQENCLNALGLRCDVCVRVCPVIDKAISLETSRNQRTGKHAIFMPVVHAEYCTGCGKCEKSCVLPEAAIKVLPERLARARLGDHYRLGWEEKKAAGHSLIPGTIDLPDRGYELTPGGGLKGFKP